MARSILFGRRFVVQLKTALDAIEAFGNAVGFDVLFDFADVEVRDVPLDQSDTRDQRVDFLFDTTELRPHVAQVFKY